jgi:ribosomal protein S1
VQIKITELDIEKRRVNLSIKQADPNWKEKESSKNTPKTHSSESDDNSPKRQTVEGVDESLENILQELKERGIGNS